MTTVPVVSRRTLLGTVYARLRDQVPAASGYVTEAGQVPPYDGNDGKFEAVPTVDTAGHVKPYWVLVGGAGDPIVDRDLGDTVVELDWPLTVTCAAGWAADLLELAGDVHTALFRWAPDLGAGYSAGPFRPPPGFQAPSLLDRDVTPHRPYLQLQFTTLITAS